MVAHRGLRAFVPPTPDQGEKSPARDTMAESYCTGPRLRRPFVVTPYRTGSDGRIQPQMPDLCPHGLGGGGCRISVHHERFRKTGPTYPLAVARCATHGVGFTLYPPGYAPYQRQPVLQLSPEGKAIHGPDDGSDDRGRDDGERSDFDATLFEAAMDARVARAWARDSDESVPERWWSTQGRHLTRAARLVGVAVELADSARRSVATLLSVDTLELLERAKSGRGYRRIGEAICAILGQLRGGPRRLMQLLQSGHVSGDWGESFHWDPGRRLLESAPFCP